MCDEIHDNDTFHPDLTFTVPRGHDDFTPYPHQSRAWDALDKHYLVDEHDAGIVVVPTGGGKTAIASRWLLRHAVNKGKRVLWLAHRRTLIGQAFQAFLDHSRLATERQQLSYALVASDRGIRWQQVDNGHDVVFATIQSSALEGNVGFVRNFIERSKHGAVVVVDEAHHAAAPSYVRLLGLLKEAGAPLLGLTATPVRMTERDTRRLWNLFEDVIFEVPRLELINRGILATPSYHTVDTRIEFERDFTEADYAHLERFGELGTQVLERIGRHAGRNKLIVEHYLEHRDAFGRTIVFAVDVLHAQTLAHEFKEAGVDADFVDYTRRDAQHVMSEFRANRSPTVLANVEMLTEGYDAPGVQTVFIVRPTRSEALLAQMVGRALRGLQANGTATATLVTFVDTWQQFDVLETEYAVQPGEVLEPEESESVAVRGELVKISHELIAAAYQLVMSNVRGTFEGFYDCLPYGWYAWVEELAHDILDRHVLIFENQVAGYERLHDALDTLPEVLDEAQAQEVVAAFFGDCPDPLPRWADVAALVQAWKRGEEVLRYTFEEKRRFEPTAILAEIERRDLGRRAEREYVEELFNSEPLCRLVYRNDHELLREELDRASRTDRKPPPPIRPVDLTKVALKAWPTGEAGYCLETLRRLVEAEPTHFPDGAPPVGSLGWTTDVSNRLWGFYRYSDRAVQINRALNSPDVPRFVVEFLLFHELLHADMPNAGHNVDFRRRERRFSPSAEAIADAADRGVGTGTGDDHWRVQADQWLDTFSRRFHLGQDVEMQR